MKKVTRYGSLLIVFCLACLPAPEVHGDGGYFSRTVAISADQRAIIIRNGEVVSMTFSTGYTGEGEEFGWIIPCPVPPAGEDVREAGPEGESAFALLDQATAPVVSSRGGRGCFPAGTEVLTTGGLRAIETVEPGTEVYACDLATDAWATAAVLRRQSFPYTGDMIDIRLGGVTVRATGNHPFFVVRGEGLEARPLPEDVPAEERRLGASGRWVEARHLREGDVLAARGSTGLAVSSLSSRQESGPVYCLEIEQYHNCAVSRAGVLVHNGGKKEATKAEAVEAEPPVTVYATVTLEHYEASILGATGAAPLLDWLEGNGYKVNPAAGKVLDAYIRENWAFVAVKLNPGENRRYENEFLPPLTVSYRHQRCLFPLRISAVSTAETAKIRLYVIAESTVSSSNLPTALLVYGRRFYESEDPQEYVEDGIRRAVGSEGRGLVVLWKGEYPDSSEFRDIPAALMKKTFPKGARTYLTRLEARMGPAAMTEDIELVPDPAPRRFLPLTLDQKGEEATVKPQRLPGLAGVVAIRPAFNHTVALKHDGTVWSWGQNQYGQLGDGSTASRLAPMQVAGLSDVVAIAAGPNHTAALKQDGTVWAWGQNQYGQLGDGSTINRVAPVQVAGISGVVAVAAGSFHTAALKQDGSVWTWGDNRYGQLGCGDTAGHFMPVQVIGASDAAAVVAGSYHTVALRRDGTLLAWGENRYGQLGDGSTTNRLTAVRVPGLSDVAAAEARHYHTVALKNDGTVWSWGVNWWGQLGDGTIESRSEPVQAAGLAEVAAIAAGYYHTVALKDDGTLWAWGYNNSGQLGDGSAGNRSAPVQVAGLAGVTAVAAGSLHTVALRKDGTLLTWGSNAHGQLGDGSRADSLRPVQVGGLSGVTAIAAGSWYTVALKNDGTVWTWGRYW